MGQYAKTTTVAPEKSRADIEKALIKYGIDKFTYGYETSRAYVAFQVDKRVVRIMLPMPDEYDEEIAYDASGKKRSESMLKKFLQQAIRQRWRALYLVVKAKLESVESSIETFDEAFMPHIVIPGGEHQGKTIGEAYLPGYKHALETGKAPKLLEM